MDPYQAFNLWDLGREVIGSPVLVFVVGLLLIIWVSAKYNVPFPATVMLSSLFAVAMAFQVMGSWGRLIWMMLLLIAGLVFYAGISRNWRRG